MKYLTLLFIYGKRQLRGGFLIALLIMPLLVSGVKYFVPEQSTSLRVGVMAEGSDELSNNIISELLKHNGYVSFVLETDEQQLVTRVKNRTYECGYIIPRDIENRINTLQLKGAIVRGENPSSILSDVIDEIVFSKLIKCCGIEVAQNFAYQNNINMDNSQLKDKYNQYVNSDAVFSLAFEKVKATSAHTKEQTSVASVGTGLMAIYIMLGGLLGCLNWYKDEKRGIYIWGMGNVISATALMCVFALLSQILAGDCDIIKQSLLMLVYFITVSGYCCLMKIAFNNATSLCGAIPVIIIGALCFCPVVFNVGAFYPFLNLLGKIFVPYYYLDYVNGGSINSMVIMAVVCWGLYLVFDKMKNRKFNL